MRTLSIVALILMAAGCKPIVKTIYGIKKPALETEASVKEYLAERKVDTTNVLTFPTVLSFAMASEQNYLTIPDAIFFNKEGFMVPYKPSAQTCNAEVPKFLADLKNFSSHPADSLRTINSFQSLIGMRQKQSNPDITVFITWSKYSGRLNKTKAFEWIRLLDKAKSDGVVVEYYLLNCDFQKRWNLTDEQLKRLGAK